MEAKVGEITSKRGVLGQMAKMAFKLSSKVR
jgi:hypothetical protein